VRRGRRIPITATLLLAGALLLLVAPAGAYASGAPAPKAAHTRNVILITADGLRIQEIFAGMDPVIAEDEKRSGIYDLERARKLYWRDTREERRLALMPFFWGTLAPRGVVLGDKEKGNSVTVRNPLLFSGPGYAEILTGQPQPAITSNDAVRSPRETVLEFVRRKLGLWKMDVATFGSWEGFGTLSSKEPGAFFTNAGYESVPTAVATPRMRYLCDLQTQIMALWETGRSDAVTFGLALEYLKQYRPRLLYIALDETDDFSHARRYDRYLDDIHVFDGFLKVLWTALESSPSYRGRTTLILTTDHGRGVKPKDWVEHGEGIAGSEDIWIAIVGPDTPPRGDAAPSPAVTQSDVAATLLRFFGLNDREFNQEAGPPIAAAFAASTRSPSAGRRPPARSH
jgi:hypothetical protein